MAESTWVLVIVSVAVVIGASVVCYRLATLAIRAVIVISALGLTSLLLVGVRSGRVSSAQDVLSALIHYRPDPAVLAFQFDPATREITLRIRTQDGLEKLITSQVAALSPELFKQLPPASRQELAPYMLPASETSANP